MPWIVFGLAAVFFSAISSLLQRVLMKNDKSDAYSYSVVFQLLGALVVGLFAVYSGFEMPPVQQYPLNFLLLPVLYGIGTYCLFKAYRYLEASEITIVTASRVIVTITSAVILLKEVFDLKQLFGTLLILLSVVLISQRLGKIKLNRGIYYALGMAIFYGLAITNDAYLLKHVDIYSYTAIGFLLPGLFLIVVNPKVLFKLKAFLKGKLFFKMLILDICYGTSAIFFYKAIESGANASQITPILQATVIITVILAAIFLKERDHLVKKFICAVLVTIGVILIT